MITEKGTNMFKDLIESKAIYYFAAVAVLVVIGTVIDYQNWNECRSHGFSVLFCLSL
jgi:hypothetical protein